jgi:hypothetical protein
MKFSHILTHSIRDRVYRIIWRAPRRDKTLAKDEIFAGECDFHKRTIHLAPLKDGLELLDSVLEEGIHASFFDIEDSAVRAAVRDIRRLLVRMGIEVTFRGK